MRGRRINFLPATEGASHASTLRGYRWLAPFFLLFISVSAAEPAPTGCDRWVARVVSVKGMIEAKVADERRWHAAKQGQRYCANDMLRVRENSRAALELANETIVRLNQKATIVLTAETKEAPWLELLKGAVHLITRTPSSLKIKTPYVNAAVEGTEFVIRVEEGKTVISVIEGRVRATNDHGELVLTHGQSASARAGEAPVMRLDIAPEDVVQWSLYYPSVIDRADSERSAPILEANRLLTVGQVDQAQLLLDAILRQNPDHVVAHAMRSVIELVQNRNDKAYKLAQRALTLNPGSPEAAIALSYAQQAQFDLHGANETLKTALRFTPDNSILLARRAELLLSLGDLDRAEQLARQALGVDPEQAHALTILGFVHLGQFEVARAKSYFAQAIVLNQADPLPRLGLGLVAIRDGDLATGRREIEIAATLSPTSAIIRSYLGKAYYEEKRNHLAAEQFMLAKSLDPNDPTPWFYDAIRKQSQNRPIEALRDLQRSIRLNDNRAVYRSRLLLDQDHAARGSSLARIYNDLGFQQLALSEGWKSVNTDPGNHSAHRLLADSYAALPRHEIARVSELMQAQMLQPLNLNPIQPQLAESSLGILDGSGPTSASANEFNPLFTRNRFSLQMNGVIAEQHSELEPTKDHGIRSSDLLHSGVWGRYSYSLGTFHDYNEGIRPNNDRDREIDNAFIQAAIDHNTSVQFEYRNTQTAQGDLPLRYDPERFTASERKLIDSRALRFGLRHGLAPGNTLLFSAIETRSNWRRSGDYDFPVGPPFGNLLRLTTLDQFESGHTFEIQHLFNGRAFNIISGAGTYRSDSKRFLDIDFSPPSCPPFCPLEMLRQTDVRHHNGYLYTNLKHSQIDLTGTFGLSVDDPTTLSNTTTQINPKLGLIWQPVNDTTIRAAAFRTMARSFTGNQTLEPTQVAGFNQFFDDINNADIRRYGVALERTDDALHLGLETSKREIEVPFLAVRTNTTFKADWKEYLGRAYAYWTPVNWAAVRAEYLHETFKRPPRSSVDARDDSTGIPDLTTHHIPLGLSLFSNHGITTDLTATRTVQTGTYATSITRTSATTVESGDRFWVVDAAISYRLPKRMGNITIGAKNLLDKKFNFHNTDIATTRIQPERLLFTRLSLSF